jgi:MFS family permease
MALAGVGHALTMLAVGVLLTRAVSERRHGLVFGVAQAAAPLAALLTGLALPTIALSLGWRVAFVLAALLGIAAAAVMPRIDSRPRTAAAKSERDVPMRSLVPLAIAMALASAGGNSAVVFLVPSTVDAGFLAGEAGLVLAIASIVGLLVRVGAGWLGDLLRDGALLLMAILLALGGAGFAGLAVSTNLAAVILAATLAFGGGWGWPGLMLLAAARSSPSAPGVAMGVLTLGGLSGAVVGPTAFGTVADALSFTAAWLLMAALAAVAVVLVVWSDRAMRRLREAREPTSEASVGGGPAVPRSDEADRVLR